MEGERLFRGLLEAAPDALLGVARDGRIVFVNAQAERLFGASSDDLLGQPVEVLVPEDRRGRHLAHRERYTENPTTRPMGAGLELEGRRWDGSTFPAEISLSALETEDGLVATVAVRDVSDRTRAAQELRAARDLAEQANKAKSEFLSRMSHELRTPLNAILGFGQLLELGDPRLDQAEHIDFILKAGRHLLDLIDEVLDMSRIEAGKLPISLVPVPVVDVVTETVELVRPIAQDRRVLFRIDPSAPRRVFVRADPQRLKQVLLNLASNAVKYNRTGGEVDVSWQVEDERVRLTVRDTGIGIRPDAMDRLFLPFERLGTDVDVEGTGLGLALSKGLMRSMDGTIGADSEYRSGTTFWVELSEVPGPVVTAGGGASVAIAEREQRPERHRVLYVEDNLSNLRLVEHILSRRGDIELVPTLQGGLAVELARTHHPDLVLLDLHLPDIDGEEVLARFQAEPTLRATPVVVVSADATAARVDRLLAAGALGYLTKPIDVAAFIDLIDSVLGTSPRRP